MKVSRYHPVYDADIDRLCDLFSKESLAEYSLETNKAAVASIKRAVKDHVFLLTEGKRAYGIIAGYLVAAVGNNKPALQEVIWYVDPDHRSQGKELLDRFEEYAKEVGAKMIVMCLMCNSMQDRIDKLYRKLGYKPFEVQYMKEIS